MCISGPRHAFGVATATYRDGIYHDVIAPIPLKTKGVITWESLNYEGFRIEEVKIRYNLGSKGGQAKRVRELLISNYDSKTGEKAIGIVG